MAAGIGEQEAGDDRGNNFPSTGDQAEDGVEANAEFSAGDADELIENPGDFPRGGAEGGWGSRNWELGSNQWFLISISIWAFVLKRSRKDNRRTMASSGLCPAKPRRRICTFSSMWGASNNSSRRVPDLWMSTAG